MGKNKTLAFFALMAVVVMWGISFVSIKVLLQVFSPISMAFCRFVIATLVLIIIKRVSTKEKVQKKDYGRMAISGAFAITLYYICENNGLMRVSANCSSIIVATLPVVALISDKIFYNTKISKINIVSIIASIFGIYLVIGKDVIDGSFLGYLFLALSIICWCGYMVLTKPLFEKYSNITITTYQAIFGTIGFIPFLPFEHINFSAVNGSVILNLLFLALICSAFCNFAYNYAYKELGVALSTLCLNLCPVVTFIFSFLLLGEKLTALQVVGAIIIIVAVTVVTKPGKEKESNYDN